MIIYVLGLVGIVSVLIGHQSYLGYKKSKLPSLTLCKPLRVLLKGL